MEIIPITVDDNGALFEGSLYFVLSGNAVLGSQRLDCYTYNPNNHLDDNGIKTILAEIGGYEVNIVAAMEDSYLRINGKDGFDDGYYARISSVGKVVDRPTTDDEANASILFEIFDFAHNKVYSTTLSRVHEADVDENAFIE
jgi:hypothetical protein